MALNLFYFLAAAGFLAAAVECAFFAGAIWPALAPHFLQKRSLAPSSRKRAPRRVGLPQAVQTNNRFDSWIGMSFFRMPPCGYFWLRRMCFLAPLTPSTMALPVARS